MSEGKGGNIGKQVWAEDVWTKIRNKMSIVLERNKDSIPYTTDKNGRYIDMFSQSPAMWTNGFWPGMLWLLYQGTGEKRYLSEATNIENKLDTALFLTNGISENLDHDVGFLWHISAGVDFRLTENPDSYRRMMLAANHLMARYNLAAGFLTAWNDPERQGWSIIDTMMNLPLLYQASAQTGYHRYAQIAMAHADKTMNHLIRPDGSSAHIVRYDVADGGCLGYLAGQGASPESSWSRGQGWAIYGFALSYRYTKKPEYLDTAKRAAHYFISQATVTDYIPKSDFRGKKNLLDTTAGVIAANGMLEIARWVPEEEQEAYKQAAYRLLTKAVEEYCDWNDEMDAILTMGSERYTDDHEMTIIYGDYFLIEAIMRMRGLEDGLW